MSTPYTPEEVEASLTVLLRSGSAAGREDIRRYLLESAKRMAAATEMLEALYWAKEVLEISEVRHSVECQAGREPYLKIVAAIASATGKGQ